MNTKLLEGKVALITGGSRGIGKRIAEKFADAGAIVAFTYLTSEEKAGALEKDLAGRGAGARAYRSDASDFQQVEKLVETIVQEFGTVDIVVNNAGITRDGLLMRMSEENWDAVITTNLKSVFNVTKAVQRPMLKQRKGSIINMSSVVGIEGNPGQSNYAASKAGIHGFTKSIAQELGSRNIRCNAIAPGFIETEMTKDLSTEVINGWLSKIPMNRPGTTEEVAQTALFLASDLSSFINGQIISVCGGMHT